MTENGYEYIDLGLPSGIMWATCNVGADKPEEYGLLFQFGRVDGYRYGDENHKFRLNKQNKQDTGSPYIPITSSGKTYDKNEILDLADDAAHVNMGGKWRMQTKDELEELFNNTTHKVETINGVKGMLFISNINGHKLFIPFIDYCDDVFNKAGSGVFVWSSQVHDLDVNSACRLYCTTKGYVYVDSYARSYAFLVRGVFKPNDNKDNINMLI